MPSFNIKDYIIAGLLAIIIGLGVVMFYDNIKLNYLEEYKEQSEELAKQQSIKIALLKENSKKTEEYLNEKYEVELNILNSTVDRLRQRNASLMPSVPEGSRNPDEACFGREELNEAITRYRAGVQGLVRKGAEGIIESDIAKEWIEKETKLYE